MSDEITPHAKPIPITGEPEWFPPSEDAEVSTAAPQPSAVRRIFFGRDGMRAGWALLLWFAFIGMLARGVNAMLHLIVGRQTPTHTAPEWVTLAGSAFGFLVVGAAALIVSRVERRPWPQYGIGVLRGRIGELVTGLVEGFALLSLLVGVLWKLGYLTFHGVLLHGAGTILLWALILGLSFLCTGFFEEFAFRGFPQFTIARGVAGVLRTVGMEHHANAIAFWITAVLLAIAFGAVHAGNPGEGRLGLYSAGLIGFAFAYSLWRTGSLWWAIGFHAAWDWAESYFYGTADSGGVSPHRLMQTMPFGNTFFSGGTVGPEGSIFVLPIIVLVFVLIRFTVRVRPGSPAAQHASKLT